MVDTEQVDQLIDAIDEKGFATSCPPDDFSFLSPHSKGNYKDALNSLRSDGEASFESVELDERWGTCVAIYRNEEDFFDKALEVLNEHAEKNQGDEGRRWP
jgi:hypothetical protein